MAAPASGIIAEEVVVVTGPPAELGDWLQATYAATVTFPDSTSIAATIPAAADVSFCCAAAGEIFNPDSPLTYTDAVKFGVIYSW